MHNACSKRNNHPELVLFVVNLNDSGVSVEQFAIQFAVAQGLKVPCFPHEGNNIFLLPSSY